MARKKSKAWGSSWKDFLVKGNDARPSTRTRPQPRTKKKVQTKRPTSQLNPEVDEFEQYIQILEADAERIFVDPSEVTSPENEVPDEGQAHVEEDDLDDLPYGWLEMDTETLDKMIGSAEIACGEPPGMDLSKHRCLRIHLPTYLTHNTPLSAFRRCGRSASPSTTDLPP
jgi:hypothetical protein